MDNQRGTTAQPVTAVGAVPGTTAALPTELTHVEPTKIDEKTQQGAVTRFRPAYTAATPHTFVPRFSRLRLTVGREGCDIRPQFRTPRYRHTAIDPRNEFLHMSSVGSTQPGDGAAVRVVVGAPSWREKFIGYAKKSRGTMLRRVRA